MSGYRNCMLAGAAFCGLLWLAGVASAQDKPADFRKEFQASLTALPETGTLSVRRLVYVPAYAKLRTLKDKPASGHATTLRIDNISPVKPIVIERIDYFDTGGTLVQRYLDGPVALKPFSSVEIFIPADDDRGGTAPNFVVAWAGAGPIPEPMIEAVMLGSADGSTYSFRSEGRAIRPVGSARGWFHLR